MFIHRVDEYYPVLLETLITFGLVVIISVIPHGRKELATVEMLIKS
ncbi:MAG: hypothetical protein ACTS8R_02840 [Arsenophonus sp. NC-QC1-MAG3]